MIDVKVLKKLDECINFLRDNLDANNYALVYEVACHRYGTAVVSSAAILLIVAGIEAKKCL